MSEMLDSIAPELWLVVAGLALLVGAASFAAGRLTGSHAARIQELTIALDDAQADAEGARVELSDYRRSVSDHFAGTSDKLRELTLQYRAVYDHLATGANMLCPESFEQLGGGLAANLAADGLPEAVPEVELETDELPESDLDPGVELEAEAQLESAPEVLAEAEPEERGVAPEPDGFSGDADEPEAARA